MTLRLHMLDLINRDRAAYGLGPVRLDEQASAIADDYCRRQIRERTTGHFTTDGLSPYMRYSFAGGDDGVTENTAAWSSKQAFTEGAIYEMTRRSEDAMMGEMAPHDGHRRAILDPAATHVGIGIAWERGEFRLAQEFVRRYVSWTRPLPREAKISDSVIAGGKPFGGMRIEAITVHHESVPSPMSIATANAIDNYSLPENRDEYLPRMKSEAVRTQDDGSVELASLARRGGRDFRISDDGAFTFNVPFTDGPGVYTIVVWVGDGSGNPPIAASNVSIRVESETLRTQSGGSR
jgi:hypothetical protein